jgi:hypothetical protein
MNGTASECEFGVLRATPSSMQHGCKGICCRNALPVQKEPPSSDRSRIQPTAADPEMKDSKKNIDPQATLTATTDIT